MRVSFRRFFCGAASHSIHYVLSVVYRCLRLLLAHGFNFFLCVGVRRILISLGLLFIPTEKNRFITCNLINFLISSLFLRCVCVSSPFFRCHCVCSFCAVRAIVSAVACLHMREMLSMKWMWFHSSRVSWRVCIFYIYFHSFSEMVNVFGRWHRLSLCGGGQRRTHVEPLP